MAKAPDRDGSDGEERKRRERTERMNFLLGLSGIRYKILEIYLIFTNNPVSLRCKRCPLGVAVSS